MINRCTYICFGKKSNISQRANRKLESSKDSAARNLQCNDLPFPIHYSTQQFTDTASNLYYDKRISPYRFSVSFPTSIWGFSLLHKPGYATSFGVLKSNIFIQQPANRL
jgi:hypothetical protein